MDGFKTMDKKTLGALAAALVAVLAVVGLVLYFSTVGFKSQDETDQSSLSASTQNSSEAGQDDGDADGGSAKALADVDNASANAQEASASDAAATTTADLSSLLNTSNATNALYNNALQSLQNAQGNQTNQNNQTNQGNTGNQGNGEGSQGNSGNGDQTPDDNANGGGDNTPVPTTQTVTGTDGGSYTVPADVKKFFTCNGVATEMVLMIGGSDACATLGSGFNASRLFTSMQNVYPDLASIVTTARADATLENMALYKADVLLSDTASTVSGMSGKAVMVSVGSPGTLGATGKIIAQALATPEAANKYNAWATYYNEMQQKALQTAYSMTEHPVAVFARGIGASNGASTITVGGASSMADSWITLGGGINAGHTVAGNFVSVNVEEFAALANTYGRLDCIFVENDSGKAAIEGNPTMQALMTQYGTKVVLVPNGLSVWSNAAAESPLMPIWAGYAMDIPEYKQQYNLSALTKDFYKSFFGYNLSDSDYSLVTGL